MATPRVDIQIKPFDGLSLRELYACMKLRGEVFVVGQQICSEPDVDEDDPLCHHVMMWLGDELVGTARLKPVGDGRVIKVGRVAVAGAYRGGGLGSSMMRAIQAWIGQVPGRSGAMSAQAQLERWYGSLGWISDSSVYMEAGIPHIQLLYPLKKPD